MYEACARYIGVLEENAQAWDKSLPIYPAALSNGWKRFASPEKRLAQTGPFIESIIERLDKPKGEVRIFDAATGVGFETVYLLKHGYLVQSNEIEASLRHAANAYASEQDTTIPAAQFSSSDWLYLDQDFSSGQYDLVLVLGNSLCHLETTEQLKTAMAQFRRLLRPGGMLVCDERNFDAILRDWDEISKDPINNFPFNRNADRVMYCGTDVLGAPFNRSDNRIVFEYWEVARTPGPKPRYEPKRQLGSLSMFAFKQGQMRDMLRDAGFKAVETMFDLKPAEEYLREGREPDFLTHIAVK